MVINTFLENSLNFVRRDSPFVTHICLRDGRSSCSRAGEVMSLQLLKTGSETEYIVSPLTPSLCVFPPALCTIQWEERLIIFEQLGQSCPSVVMSRVVTTEWADTFHNCAPKSLILLSPTLISTFMTKHIASVLFIWDISMYLCYTKQENVVIYSFFPHFCCSAFTSAAQGDLEAILLETT